MDTRCEQHMLKPVLQPGNPKPRVFHLSEDSALINRYGFPSQGHAALLRRLEARYTPTYSSPARPLLAVNLGKNKTSPMTDDGDYVSGVQRFAPHADALVINVSSPNTPGLRGLQDPRALDRLLAACTSELKSVQAQRRPRLLLKLAPDLDEEALAQIALVAVGRGVDGVIVSNTTIARPKDLSHRRSFYITSRWTYCLRLFQLIRPRRAVSPVRQSSRSLWLRFVFYAPTCLPQSRSLAAAA
jgi:dihydroorotate dehydrogenase